MLPAPDVWLSLTSVENLAEACLHGLGWPPAAFNIADARPHLRDALVVEALAATGLPMRVIRLPLRVAAAAARAMVSAGTWLPIVEPALTPYAVDQLGHDIVLDIGRARAHGWMPRRAVADYLARQGPPAG